MDFILRVSFAGPVALGFDPTVTLLSSLQSNEQPQYDIVVRDSEGSRRKFRTQKILSSIGAEALRGRGTRVWEVIEVDDSGKTKGGPYALKDCWIQCDHQREGDIMRKIRAAAKEKQHSDTIDAHLLTTVTHGDVHVSGTLDSTRAWDMPQSLKSEDPHIGGTNLTPDGRIALPCNTRKGSSKPKYVTRIHYRIVFKEVGKAIRDVRSLHFVFKYLSEILKGEQPLSCLSLYPN